MLLQSLIDAPLLIGNLPEAPSFLRSSLSLPEELPRLNVQQKLGHLYEDALAALLVASPAVDLLAKNLQLQKDSHSTVGELDFLLRDLSSGQLIHLELATKFYLAVGDEFPGPDARDNYFKKLARLRDHQLTLVKNHQALLPDEFREESIVTQQLIYGCLFDHIDSPVLAEPEFLNPGCRRGKWLRVDEVPEHFPVETEFHMIPKALWPVPLELLAEATLEKWSPEETLERCVMVRIDGCEEPYFIAPTSYPLRSEITKVPSN
ncbi:MAG: DUF1853 family protein [Akkermansiaceae bacterium]